MVELEGETLTVRVTGLDQILAFKHTLEIPIAHVAGIDEDSAEARSVFHGLRLPGTNLPGDRYGRQLLAPASGPSGMFTIRARR